MKVKESKYYTTHYFSGLICVNVKCCLLALDLSKFFNLSFVNGKSETNGSETYMAGIVRRTQIDVYKVLI